MPPYMPNPNICVTATGQWLAGHLVAPYMEIEPAHADLMLQPGHGLGDDAWTAPDGTRWVPVERMNAFLTGSDRARLLNLAGRPFATEAWDEERDGDPIEELDSATFSTWLSPDDAAARLGMPIEDACHGGVPGAQQTPDGAWRFDSHGVESHLRALARARR